MVHVGPAGSGRTVKAANQLIVAGTIELVAEAIVFLEAHGVDTEAAVEVLAGGPAGNAILDRTAAAMLRRDFQTDFRIELHHKDLLGATLRPGTDLVLDLADFRTALPGAGLVVTGEGSLDEQTLHGKAPAGVAAAARGADVPVVAVAGRSLLTLEDPAPTGIRAAYALTDIDRDPARCMSEAGLLLEQLAERLAADWVSDDDDNDRGATA